MKRSNPGRASVAAMLIGLGASSVTGAALAQETTYQPWSGTTQAQANQTSDQKLQSLVTDLNALIKKAETANAADPNFLADLKKLAAKYPVTPSLGGPGTVFLYDNFADGNYTANPVWKVSAGTWEVDTKGTMIGLSSKLGASTSTKVTGNDVLKAILGVQEQQAPQSTYASIYTAVPIANSFRMTMKLVSVNKNGPLNIGPYQGASASSGYRLVYHPGKDTGLVLQRIVGNQVTQIGAYNDPLNLEDGKTHELMWQREPTGKMRVYLDNQQLIIATDTQITGNLDGWLNVNQGGAYWIREIKVVGL
ncbi:hypothetical protein [Dongia deserti]|uniref:hypothetical protein n=1 Tax=Dongia deserti TaxID=2268030 RepID=UPI0013C3F352|nr:hypothetical protein [Dongia deserti]